MKSKAAIAIVVLVIYSPLVYAQNQSRAIDSSLLSRVSTAPTSVIKTFLDAGMKPTNHLLTAVEKSKVERAMFILPRVHQQILRKHLHSISFMDNMPNNALTSPVDNDDSTKHFNVTFRAGILNETISEWSAKKENTSFNAAADGLFRIEVDAGKLDAIQYVLLHEASHVVDAVMNITPHPETREAIVEPTSFTRDIWQQMAKPVPQFADSVLRKASQRNRSLPIASALQVYAALEKTPFVSLYGMAAWFEDFAELMTIYHLTQKMKQPYRVIIRKNRLEIARFEPMKNNLVLARTIQLESFY